MKIVILTQEDSFFIPQNVERIISMKGIEVSIIFVLDTKGSLINRKSYFIQGFGLLQSTKMSSFLIKSKVLNFLDSMFGYTLLKAKNSIKAVAMSHKVPFQIIKDPNNEVFIKQLKTICPDLVVSFSAPCVFKKPLLSLPKLGCINLHCSRLPDYAGLLPSFWMLSNHATKAGATVHYMDDKIDNGKIIRQGEFNIAPGTTMFELIGQTKKLGGQLMLEAIEQLRAGSAQLKENIGKKDAYFSWPSVDQMKEFRKLGGRFV